MKRILGYFKRKRLEKKEREDFLQHALVAYKKSIEADARRTQLYTERMASDIPWCKLVGEPYSIETPPISPISERYQWNNAFIKKLRTDGYTGETDTELISKWEIDMEHNRLQVSSELARKIKRNSNTPWVEVISEVYDDTKKQVAMNLDWNQAFIKMLISNGYTGTDDQEIIDRWFKNLSKSIAEDLNTRGFDG